MKNLIFTVALLGCASAVKVCIHQEKNCQGDSQNCFEPVLNKCEKMPSQMAKGNVYYIAEDQGDTVSITGYRTPGCDEPETIAQIALTYGQCEIPRVAQFKLFAWAKATKKMVDPPVKPEPVKPADKSVPVKPTDKSVPVKPTDKSVPVKPTDKSVPVEPKPKDKPEPAEPKDKPEPVKPEPVEPKDKPEPAKPTSGVKPGGVTTSSPPSAGSRASAAGLITPSIVVSAIAMAAAMLF